MNSRDFHFSTVNNDYLFLSNRLIVYWTRLRNQLPLSVVEIFYINFLPIQERDIENQFESLFESARSYGFMGFIGRLVSELVGISNLKNIKNWFHLIII
jgi:hypothetical protein